MKFDQTLMTTVEKILKTNHVPMLLGEPGIGKSSWVEALGEQMHTSVFVLACNQLSDKADLTGCRLMPVGTKKTKSKDGTVEEITDYAQCFFPHIVIKNAIDYANAHPTETPILFLDELNRTTPDVTSEALSLPTLRSIGDVALPKNLRIITAGNDKGNITSLDEASRSRFVLMHVTPDVETFIAVNKDLNPFVKNVLMKHPETIFGKGLPASLSGIKTQNDDDDDDNEYNIDEILDEGEDMTQLATPRTITSISDFLNTCSNDELKVFLRDIVTTVDNEPVTVLQEILEAHTGKTAFTAILLQEITAGINTINSQSNVFTVPKPACYDAMTNQPTHDALHDFIDQMSDRDKSGCLVYALSAQTDDNTDVITALALTNPTLERSDTNNLATLFSTGAVNETNKSAFFNSGSQLATTWSMLFA